MRRTWHIVVIVGCLGWGATAAAQEQPPAHPIIDPLPLPTAVGPAVMAGYAGATGGTVASDVLLPLVVPLLICGALSILPALVMRRYRRDVSQARKLGSYRLVSRIGEGGMGEVWRARHQMLARPAAIKLIRPEAVASSGGSSDARRSREQSALRRFEREAQATASLQSPHTIQVYDFGMSADGSFYYVMELLNGMDARSFVQRFGPMPAGRAIYLLRQVCHSLAEAHELGLIHRDVKPANIHIARRGRDHDFVKVLDFGLVKGVPGARRDETQLTADGAATGTPAYMAPEVALGAAGVSAKIDIYALGCLAHWLLTGHDVFEGDSGIAVAIKHIQEQPAPPSDRSELPIPRELDDLVLQCLEKEAADRPKSVLAIIDALDACPVEPWSAERARKWWQRHAPAAVAAETSPGN